MYDKAYNHYSNKINKNCFNKDIIDNINYLNYNKDESFWNTEIYNS